MVVIDELVVVIDEEVDEAEVEVCVILELVDVTDVLVEVIVELVEEDEPPAGPNSSQEIPPTCACGELKESLIELDHPDIS